MSVRSGQRKISGSAADYRIYLEEERMKESEEKVLDYYALSKDGIVFDKVAGKAAAHLDGLDLSRGLTRDQYSDIFNGRWGDQQLVKGNYRPVYKTDEKGNVLREVDPKTGRLRKVPEMVDVLDREGQPVLDPLTGKTKQKMKTEPMTVAGYDVTYALDKSAAEFLVAHPEYTDLVKRNFLEAVNTANTVGIEEHCDLIVKTTAGVKERRQAEGLLWFTVFGNSARPTEKSMERGYEVDPHVHAHCFLSSMAYVGDGQWAKIDGKQLFQTAEFRASVASTTFNRLMEESGVKIDYADPDRKGRIYSQIEGSNVEARQFFSTNNQRAWKLQLEFENKHNRPPTAIELNEIMSATKGGKTKRAKDADQMGNLEQASRWREALKSAGIELTIGKPKIFKSRPSLDDRLEILYARLERPEGVARDIGTVPMFGPVVILPAVFRASEGLGFSAGELAFIADHYRDTKLILVREANDPSANLYTTRSLLDAERDVAEGFERLAATAVEPVPEINVSVAIRSQRFSLDPEQVEAVQRICSSDRVAHVIGKAGSGKTASIKPAIDALRRSGQVDQVVVLSVGRNRAVQTGKSLNAEKSWSVEALEMAVANGWKAGRKTAIVFDEIAMADTHRMAKVLNSIGTPHKFISVGDSAQANAIGAAGFLPREHDARPPVMLNKVHRHKDFRDRDAFDLIRQGDAHAGLDNLVQRGRVFAADNPQDLVRLIQQRYEHYREKGYAGEDIAVINTGLNVTVDSINRAIQRSRLEAGELSEWAHFDVTEQSTGRRWRLHGPGARGQIGERIIFNEGYAFQDFETKPITNGTEGTILRIDADGACRIQLDGDERRTVTIHLSPEANVQPVAPNYAASTNKQQGLEVPVVIVVPGNEGIASLNTGYSATTRGIDVTEVVVDHETWGKFPVQRLGEAWSEAIEKEMATPYLRFEDEAEEEIDDLDVEQTVATEAVEHIRKMKTDLGGGMHL